MFAHMGLTPEARKNVSMNFYTSGHMLSVHRPSLPAPREGLRGSSRRR